MKFKSFQSNAQLGTPNSGMTNFRYSDPGAIAAAKESGQIGVTMAKGAMDLVEQHNDTMAMEATNYYNKRMREEKTNLINTKKEGNAANITEDYAKIQQKVDDETRTKYGQYINYGKAGATYKEFTTRDRESSMAAMASYQASEMEKHQQTTYANGMLETQQMVADGGSDYSAVMAGKARAEALVREMYKNHGEDRIKLETWKANNAISSGAVDNLVAQERIDDAEKTWERLRPDLTTDQNNAYQKMFVKRHLEKAAKSEAATILEANGWDREKAIAASRANRGAGSFNKEASDNIIKEWSQYTYTWGGHDCSAFSQTYAKGQGVDVPRTADIQASWAEQEGRFVKDAKDLKPGHSYIIFWQNTDSQFAPTDDPNGSDDTHAYKGVTHAGVVTPDSLTRGGAVQMGTTENLKEIPIDTYQVYGFADLGGSGRTDEQQERLEAEINQQYAERESFKKEAKEKSLKNYRNAIRQEIASGANPTSVLRKYANGVTDSEERDIIYRAWAAETNFQEALEGPKQRVSSGGGNRSGGGNAGNKLYAIEAVKSAILHGDITDTNDLIDSLENLGIATTSNLNHFEKMMRDKASGKGEFSLPVNDIAAEVLAGTKLSGADDSKFKRGAELMVQRAAQKIIDEHGMPDSWLPYIPEIVDDVRDSMTNNTITVDAGWFSRDVTLSPFELEAGGFSPDSSITYDKYSDRYLITTRDGQHVKSLTLDEVRELDIEGL